MRTLGDLRLGDGGLGDGGFDGGLVHDRVAASRGLSGQSEGDGNRSHGV